MDSDLATQLVTLNAQQTQTLATIAVMRKQHQMEMAAVAMIDDAASKASAPPGQGTQVDKTA